MLQWISSFVKDARGEPLGGTGHNTSGASSWDMVREFARTDDAVGMGAYFNQRNADIDTVYSASDNMMGGGTLLHLACAEFEGRPKVIRGLISLGADLEVRSPRGATPLLTALSCHALGSAEMLVRAGANVNAVNANGLSILMVMVAFQYEAEVDWLLSLHEQRDVAEERACARQKRTRAGGKIQSLAQGLLTACGAEKKNETEEEKKKQGEEEEEEETTTSTKKEQCSSSLALDLSLVATGGSMRGMNVIEIAEEMATRSHISARICNRVASYNAKRLLPLLILTLPQLPNELLLAIVSFM